MIAHRFIGTTATVRLLGGVAVVLGAACASAGTARSGGITPPRLAAVIDSVTSAPSLAATHWGIAVWDPAGRRWLARVEADRHFVPASGTKLVVAAVALATLGPDYRYETPVYASVLPGDTVARDLVVIGRGDPTFSKRFREGDFAVTDSMAALVAAAGIRRITGGITLDVSFFGDGPLHGTWEVGDLPWSFASPIEAFAIGEGTFGLIRSGAASPGGTARVTTVGPQGLQPVSASIRTDTAGARATLDAEFLDRSDVVRVAGSVAAGRTDTTWLAATRPARYAGRALEWALRAHGVRVDGGIRVLRDSAEAASLRDRLYAEHRRIATFFSPPLHDIVAAILRPSQNWIAEMVLKTLGAEQGGSGGWSTGLEVERRYLIDVAGLDSTSFFLRDASGLSAQNLMSPAATVALLEHARQATWGAAFREALPEPGMEGSTLASRLPGLNGRLRAKTGSITHVNTLSGYLTTVDGRRLTFSIMTNGSGVPAADVRRGMDRILEALAVSR